MTRRVLGVILGLFALLPASAGAQTIELFDEPSCSQLYPSVLTPPPFGKPIDVRALILLDGVKQDVASAAMQAAAVPFKAVNLNLKVVEYREVKFTPVDPDALIDESRKAVGGGRPEGADLVYTFTSKEMTTGGALGGSVAGKVDCVSGVVDPRWAFGVGEVDDNGGEEIIAAHEIAHLLGAHHHWANCVEAVQAALTLNQCTTMINDIGLAGMKFSTLNASIMRAHAEAYLPGEGFPGAKPIEEPGGDPEPPPSDPAPPSEPPPSEPPPAEPQPAQQQQQQSQPAPPSGTPHDADRARRDAACKRAQTAFKRAGRKVTAARRQLRRRATASRRRALRRAVAARDRAEAATLKACL